jgi:hypothetical protein
MWQLRHYAQTMQRFDATFHNREPILDVTFDKGFARALNAALRDKDAIRTALLLECVTFSDDTVANIDAIWTISYMPPGGVTIAQMEAANTEEAEARFGPQGETVREMIRNSYRCGSAVEEDWFVHRFIAS